MKRKKLLSGWHISIAKVMAVALMLSFVLALRPAETEHSLNIELTGFKNNKGQAMIALYSSEKTFLKNECKSLKMKILHHKCSTTIKIEKGDYAIAVFHDENGNNKMDKNIFGAPSEDYGFSNNARNTFSAPSWKQAKFNLSGSVIQKIKVK